MNKTIAFFGKKLFWGALCLTVLGLPVKRCRAQVLYDPFEPPTIAGVVHNQLITAGRQFFQAHEAAKEATQQIEQARQTYWQQFPDGPKFAEAQADFAEALHEKDVYYLAIELSGSRQTDPFAKTTLSIGSLIPDVDGNIRGVFAYEHWVQDIRRTLGGREGQPVVASPAQLRAAMDQCQVRYIEYVRVRDWDEFLASGLDVHKYLKPKGFVLGLLQTAIGNDDNRLPVDSAAEAKNIYGRWATILGEPTMEDAANQTFTMPLDKYGDFLQPVVLTEVGRSSRDPYAYFMAAAASHDARSYLISLYQNQVDGLPRIVKSKFSAHFTNNLSKVSARDPAAASSFYLLDADRMEAAKVKYDALVQRYGELAVTNAAETVRKLNKNSFGAVPDPEAGQFGIHPADLIERLLEDPKATVPDTEILRIAATDATALKAAQGRLVTIYGKVVRMSRIETRYNDGRFFMYLSDNSNSTPQKVYFVEGGLGIKSTDVNYADLIGHEIEFTTVTPGSFDSIADLSSMEITGTVKVY